MRLFEDALAALSGLLVPYELRLQLGVNSASLSAALE